jgi:acyl-coenzyme A synthetase/AMP-(fatty) acid ligase
MRSSELSDNLRTALSTNPNEAALISVAPDGVPRRLRYGQLARLVDRAEADLLRRPRPIHINAEPNLGTVVEILSALVAGVGISISNLPTRSSNLRSAPPGVVEIYTSGTTTKPAAVWHTHETLTRALARAVTLGLRGSQLGYLLPFGYAHIGGLFTLLRAVLTGDFIVYGSPPHPRSLLQAAAASRARILAIPPPLALLMCRTRIPDGWDPSQIVMNLASMGASSELRQAIHRRFGCIIAVSYGSTELAGPIATGIIDTATTPGHYAGNILPGIEVTVEDRSGKTNPYGEPGQLLCRTDQLCLTVDGRDCRRPDGTFATGDWGAVSADGSLTVLGRIDDVILRSGFRLTPDLIEDTLAGHDSIDAAVVVGVPDSNENSKIIAFVRRAPGSVAPDVQELRAFCADLLPALYVPDEFRLVKTIPRTESGKPRRAALREGLEAP